MSPEPRPHGPRHVLRRTLMSRDPLLRLLRIEANGPSRHSTAAILFAIAWAAITALVLIVRPALVVGGEAPSPLGTRETMAALAWAWLAVPAGIYLYFWLPNALRTLVPELMERGVLVEPVVDKKDAQSNRSLEAFASEWEDRLEGGGWLSLTAAIAAIAIVGYWIYRLGLVAPGASVAAWAHEVLSLLVYTLPIYAGTFSIARLVQGIVLTTDLFNRFQVSPHPLHPDGAGGLSPLGNRIAVVATGAAGYAAAALAINLLALAAGRVPFSSPESIFTLAVLLGLAPLMLWAWLRVPHREMLEARGQLLLEVSQEFERVSRLPLKTGAEGQPTGPDAQASTDLLAALQRREQVIREAIPTWPIRTRRLQALWVTVSAPFGAWLLGIGVRALEQLPP
jgi:hypothetical protein